MLVMTLCSLQIDQGALMLPTRESYLNKTENAKLLAAYLEYMTKVGNFERSFTVMFIPHFTIRIE